MASFSSPSKPNESPASSSLFPKGFLLVLLALHGDRDRYLAHAGRGADMTVLRNSLQIRNFGTTRRFLQDFSELMHKESIETLWCAESENPLVGELRG
jgi:hypothetical protein